MSLLTGVASSVGLKRTPVVTLTVTAITAVTSVIGLASPAFLAALERTPAAFEGQWWRNVTALLVQDGGWFGTLSNLLFLVIIGSLAEQFLGSLEWLAMYFATGILTELLAHYWQPSGAGNSIAICGLAGAMIVALFARDPKVPLITPIALLYWCAALLATWLWPVALGAVAVVLILQAVLSRGVDVRVSCATLGLATAATLAFVHNIHGGALLIAVALSVVRLLQTSALRRDAV